jgi:hypothetical protein
MFQIVSATYNPSSSNANSTNRMQLFVEYKSMDNSVLTYIPSPPSVEVYLPNDVLYPFYVTA